MVRPKGDKTLRPGDSTVSFEEAKEAYDSVGEEAFGVLEQEGIPLPKKPVDAKGNPAPDVELPPNLSNLSDQALGSLMTAMNKQIDYINVTLAHWKSKKDTFKEQADAIKSRVRRENRELSKEERDDAARTDRRFIEVNRELLKARHIVELMQAAVDSKRKNYQTISRIITLRGDATQRDTRVGSVTGRRSHFR